MASIYGSDLLLRARRFWNEKPDDSESPWHQDFQYWAVEPPINISAWLAIDEVTTENGCVQILPGSHKRVVPQVETPDGK